jgi:hypothetical protein
MKRDNKGWRATLYTTALTHEHEGAAWESTPWHAR